MYSNLWTSTVFQHCVLCDTGHICYRTHEGLESAQRALRYNVPQVCAALLGRFSWRQMRNVEYTHGASKPGNQ